MALGTELAADTKDWVQLRHGSTVNIVDSRVWPPGLCSGRATCPKVMLKLLPPGL